MSVLDRFRLDGKTALVTGFNRGIGKAVAIAHGYIKTDLTKALSKDSLRADSISSRIPAGRWAPRRILQVLECFCARRHRATLMEA